jgi:four helix bundle suffix protein
MQLDRSGGYRWLDSWVMANIVQLATFRFCERFLNRTNDPCGRQYDQMTQAARSGKENLVEGSERTATSKETEMKLTDVAKASLCELRGDYETWLLRHGQVPWRRDSPEAKEVFDLRFDKPAYSQDVAHDSCVHVLEQKKKFAKWLEAEDHTIVANALLILISRTVNMLTHQIQAQGDRFEQTGGFREKLTEARTANRAKQEDAPACPDCGKPMHKRRAKTGKNAGHEFWGCTGYPDCRGVRNIEEKR